MAETVRTVDSRYQADSGPDKYFIVLCARKSENPASKPGHAFVVWGREDAAAGMSSQVSFGFYPKDGNTADAVLGENVPGELKAEAVSSGAPSLLTARVILRVDKATFDATLKEIDKWKTVDYNLYALNCISFAQAVASEMGLVGIPAPVDQLPANYFAALAESLETAYGGAWQSNDAGARFSLKIDGPSVRWTENGPAGAHEVTVQTDAGSSKSAIRIERANTDTVLQFLGFSSAGLRAEILASSPQASFLVLKRSGQTLTGEWHGLLVKKLANGKLDSLIQPSQMPAKAFTFVRA